MKICAPDYYTSFRCITENCKHTCCAGWEIEVDEETLCKYKKVTDEFGKKIFDNITYSEGVPIFRLGKDERCPFLNNKNLCDIIINLGDENLCQICADHPRFRNFYTDRTEIGLGLTCESAAELVLNKKTKTMLVSISDNNSKSELTKSEKIFFEARNSIFQTVQNRKISFEKRFRDLCTDYCITLPHLAAKEWANKLLTLEQLDVEWTEFLENVYTERATYSQEPTDIQKEQLLVYFIFRHTSPDSISAGLRFALLATDIILKLSQYSINFTELCRMFSSEIEYSDENTDFIMNF